jgi:adenylate kinase family enzyme
MVILINGSINSGKTTIAKALSKKFERTAHIEVDSLREFIESTPLNEAIPINVENTILVAQSLIKHKYNVIISYPLSRELVKQITNGLKDLDPEFYYFSLSPSLEKALTNRGTRELTEWEIKRIEYHYNKGVNNPGFGIVIDSTNQTINETVNEVMNLINLKSTLDLSIL